jgi:hypothetical protein
MSVLEKSTEEHVADEGDEGRKRRPQPGYFGLINDGLDLNRDEHDKDYGIDLQNTYTPVSPLGSPMPHSPSAASELPSSPAPTAINIQDTTESEKEVNEVLWTCYSKEIIPSQTYMTSTQRKLQDYTVRCNARRCTKTFLMSKLHGSRSNLNRHLRSHGIDIALYSKDQITQLREALKRGKRTNQLLARSSQEDSKDITQHLVAASKQTQKKEIIREFFKYLLDTNMSFGAVENKSFRRFLTLLDAPKEITTMSRISIPMKLENLCEAARKELIEKLRAQDAVSLSLDCWTSPGQRQFLSVIVHATGEDFKYYEHLLDFLSIGSDHTGKELGRLVFKVLQQFQITKKLLSISTDSGSNNLTLADNIQEQLEEFYEVEKENNSVRIVSELFQGRRSLMRCCAHSTNTIVKALLDALRTADLQCELLDSDETDNTNFDVDREGPCPGE